MSDLLSTVPRPPVTLADQIRCVERELGYRRRVYAHRVVQGTMLTGEAEREIAVMQSILDRLKSEA